MVYCIRIVYELYMNCMCIVYDLYMTLQTLHLETLNELMGVDRRMEVENRSLVEKT